jgi:hypothetical protein
MRTDEAAGVSLAETIQFHALKAEALLLLIQDGIGRRGWIQLRDHEVVHSATASGIEGFDAFVDILCWDRPEVVDIRPHADEQKSIDVELSQLLLDAFWQADQHEAVEPSATTLDKPGVPDVDTVAGQTHKGQNRLQFILEMAEKLTSLDGFVFASFIESGGEVVDHIGEDPEVPEWARATIKHLQTNPDSSYAVIVLDGFIDACVPLTSSDGIGLFVRVDAEKSNPGMLHLAIREFV